MKSINEFISCPRFVDLMMAYYGTTSSDEVVKALLSDSDGMVHGWVNKNNEAWHKQGFKGSVDFDGMVTYLTDQILEDEIDSPDDCFGNTLDVEIKNGKAHCKLTIETECQYEPEDFCIGDYVLDFDLENFTAHFQPN